jgi:hypothetical protein
MDLAYEVKSVEAAGSEYYDLVVVLRNELIPKGHSEALDIAYFIHRNT